MRARSRVRTPLSYGTRYITKLAQGKPNQDTAHTIRVKTPATTDTQSVCSSLLHAKIKRNRESPPVNRVLMLYEIILCCCHVFANIYEMSNEVLYVVNY